MSLKGLKVQMIRRDAWYEGILLMDKILHYPLEGIYHNSHSLGSLRSCRILSINRRTPTFRDHLVQKDSEGF